VVGGLGLLGWWLRRRVLPARPPEAALPVPRRIPDPDARPSSDGAGVRIAVNAESGPVWSSNPAPRLRECLPGAEVVELESGDDLVELLCAGGDDVVAIGAAGGDGTLSAAAAVAAERALPLVAVPAGTLNHLARDLGLDSVDDAIAAVRAGTVTHMDLGTAADRVFVNTLSLGGYSAVVDARERLEGRIGKWPALLVALLVELPRMEPLDMEIDGRRTRVWIGWIGNGKYSPNGLGPSWRERLDDGLLDVRILRAGHRYARTRFTLHVLAGRLQHCRDYDERTVTRLSMRSLDGPLRLAADGETFDADAEVHVSKRPRALAVAVPPPPPD
jgi:undecaprenyl-diphosphatase